MKAVWILLISAAINITLLAAVLQTKNVPKSAFPQTTDTATPAVSIPAPPSNSALATSIARTNLLTLVGEPFRWERMATADLKQYVANLRAANCPEETVQDIIMGEVNRLFGARRKAFPPPKKREYWEARSWHDDDESSRDRWKRERSFERERRALLIDLLGVDPSEERSNLYEQNQEERSWGFLQKEKRGAIKELVEKFFDQEQELHRKWRGDWGPEHEKEIRKLREERDAEVAKQLTPDEFEHFQLRHSSVAQNIMAELRGFDATEDEFKKLFAVKKTFDQVFQDFEHDPDDEEAQKKRSEGEKELQKELEASLGPERYKIYSREKDWDFMNTKKMVARLELPPETATKIWDTRDVVKEEMKKLGEQKDLTPDQKREMIKSMGAETTTALKELLGEEGLKKFKRRNGWWLESISRGDHVGLR